MRLLALDLKAYGPFTDTRLDFLEQPGLVLVYGPNEAGKSSALRALAAFLYGIEGQTADAYLHEYAGLRVGGKLQHSDGSVLEVLRKKGNKNTLLGLDGKAVEEARLQPFLAGVNRELFRSMFGIDHDQLRKGGEEMLRSEGQVGQALFSAGTGLVGLSELGKGLTEEAESLFLARGKNQTLNVLTRRYQELKKTREESVLRGMDWQRHQEALRQATEQREVLARHRQEASARRSHLERLQSAMPLVTRRGALVQELQALKDAVLLPAGFTEQRTQVYGQWQSKELDVSRLAQELERLSDELASLSPKPGLLERAEQINRLYRDLGQYLKERADVPNLRARVSEQEWDARSLTKELRPELSFEQAVEQLRLPRGRRDRIRELGNHYEARVEKPKATARARELLELERRRKREALVELTATREAGALRRVLEQVQRRGDLEGMLAERRRALQSEERQASVELGGLGQWKGELEALEQMAVPAMETVQRFEMQQGRLSQQTERLAQARRSAQEQVAVAEGELDALRRAGVVPTEEELVQVRVLRDKGWKLVRRAWIDGVRNEEEIAGYAGGARLEESFERRVQEADVVADRLRREAARVERQATLRAAVERHVRERARVEEEQRTLEAQQSAWESEWRALWSGVGVEPLPPAEMRAWLGRHQGLVERARRVRELREQVRELESEVARHRGELGRELEALGAAGAGDKESLEAVLLRARTLVKQVEEEAQRRRALAEALGELEQKVLLAQREVQEADQALQQWRREWGEVVLVLGMSASDHPTQANAALAQVEELFHRLDEAAGFKSRIKGIERNLERFTQEVAALCAEVAPELAGLAADVAANRLYEQWQEASRQATRRDALLVTREQRNTDLVGTKHERDQWRLRLEALLREAECERYEQLREVEERSERKRKAEEGLAGCEQQLSELSGGRPLETFTSEVAAVEADRLPGLLEQLAAEEKGLEEERSRLDRQIGTEEGELRRMDGSGRAGELTEEAQGLLAEMRVHSERYLLLKLASLLLQQQMEEWRKRNQNPLLERSATLFSALTVGRFSGLNAGYDEEDKQVLYGVRANGEKVPVEGMSEGTRDQLFLSLRLASLEQFLEHNEPLPLVVDDILINFDDERSTATLRVLAELAQRTQVLFFTHHAHLLGLARMNLPKGSFQVLELSTSNGTGSRPV